MKVVESATQLDELSKDAGVLTLRPQRGCVACAEEEVMAAVSAATSGGVPITPRGAGTSIASQAVGGGVILLQEDREVVLEAGGTVVCGPALVKADLNAHLDAVGSWIPVDPASYRSCTVGGMVMNNSSGARSYKYGSTMRYVRTLKVVLPEEGLMEVRPLPIDEALHAGGVTRRLASLLVENAKAIADDAPPVTKNSSGYRLEGAVHDGLLDLPRIFTGSEGTLGVTTKVRLSTGRRPASRMLTVVETSLDELDGLAAALRSHGPSAIELVDKSVFRQTGRVERLRKLSRSDDEYILFCEFDGPSIAETQDALQGISEDPKVSSADPLVLEDPGDVAGAWDLRNGSLAAAGEMRRGSRLPVPGVEDVVVPPGRLGAILKAVRDSFEARGLEYISYGHAGDANLHMRPLLDVRAEGDRRLLEEIMEECFEAVWKMRGSITGEHGDGRLRAPYVERQYPRTYWIMKEVKSMYDPRGIMNPGVKLA